MIPYNTKDYRLSPNIDLTIIDIESMDENIIKLLDEHFVLICEGETDGNLSTVKRYVSNLFSTKNHEWIMGAIAEFFIHLHIRLIGFKQECLFLNLEENSIKKGFDGYYSKDKDEWLMESKAGAITSVGISHANKVDLAMKDLDAKVSGRDKSGKKKLPNNPWREAFSHANQYSVGAAKSIRDNIKKLSDDFTNGKFRSIEDFNTMPCGTIFLVGTWIKPNHEDIKNSISKIANKLKGKHIHVICVTQNSVDLFMQYLALG